MNLKTPRLSDILRSKYEKFNECYKAAYTGSRYEERDEYRLVIESVKELSLKPGSDKPQTYALIAYMLLKASRLRAIINNVARVADLKNQNRLLWDKGLIKDGLDYLSKSAGGNKVSEYHLRAGICACHSLAKDYQSTDWMQIISLYDQYLEIDDSFEIALERAHIISQFKGPKTGIEALLKIDPKNNLDGSKVLNANLAELYIKQNQYNQAIDSLSKSHEFSETKKEKTLYLNKIEFCRQQLLLSKKYQEVLSF